MRKISIVGCGTIGSEVAMAVDRDAIPMQLMSLYDVDREKAVALRQKLRHVVPGIAATHARLVERQGKVVLEDAGSEQGAQITPGATLPSREPVERPRLPR